MHFASDHARAAVIVSCTLLGLDFIVVCLRQYAQSLKGRPLAPDAWFLIAALIVSSGLVGLTIYGATDAGLGWPAKMLLGPAGPVFQKVVYSGQMLWAAAITLIRVSLLLFYRRIFPIPTFRMANNIMIGICGAWWLSNFIATLFTYKWSATSQTSINYPMFLLVNAIINLLLDFATLSLPLFVIRTLHISARKKMMIGAIFGLGIICVVASIVRAYYFVRLSHITQRNRSFSGITYYCFVWSVVEPCISIIAACLPACAPLINKETRGFSILLNSFKSLFQSRGSQQDSSDTKFVDSRDSNNKSQSKFTWKVYMKSNPGDMEMLDTVVANDDGCSQHSTSRLRL